MDPTAATLPLALVAAGWILAAPLVAHAVRVAPWRRVIAGEAVHAWYGGIFCLIVLWSIQATIGDTFTFHLLGVSAFTLAVGPALALAGAALALALEIAVRGATWVNAGVAFVTMVAVPVAVTALVLRFAERRLPPNFFVFVFVGAFFGAWLSYGAAALAGAAVLALGAFPSAATVFGEYAPYFLYLAFGEATLTGMVITLAIVYRPQWIATFDDARYLDGR
ncbi:MAG TPA: energy-coupling factor ABC transporter permease [Casimicrobiaceae bacterium]|nr:energy-coupling factor ABC transporter permease [Casimicrobiaceae bacterium]